MATTTTNYGFDIPQSTDLVKDGATAIATLGQDIDTAMNTALGTKKAGMVLLNTTSFSGVSSVSLPANTFSSTYRNYRLIYKFTQITSIGNLTLRYRTTGTDNTTSNYNYGGFFGGISSVVTRRNATAQNSFAIINSIGVNTLSFLSMDIISPNLAEPTFGFFNFWAQTTSDLYSIGTEFPPSTVFDSASLITSAGGLTGTVECYGYNI
jgi:hypothetical protein